MFRAQRFWFVRAWRLTARARNSALRLTLRAVWFAALAIVVWPLVVWMLDLPRLRYPFVLLAVWFASATFSWLGVLAVAGIERAWNGLRAWRRRRFSSGVRELAPVLPSARLASRGAEFGEGSGLGRFWRTRAKQASRDQNGGKPPHSIETAAELLPNPSRRYLFQTAAAAVGFAPFAVSLYGYFGERLRYVVERAEVPIPNLPAALDGLRIAQLSDIHIGLYLPREEVRRVVEMTNELAADLAVITGDFVTRNGDPLEDCVEELAALRAPLGVWGCNGNHEIYARCEARAASLFRQGGMRLLRAENAEVVHRGQALNLIGVDYQRTRAIDGPRRPMLEGIEPLIRRDAPNILLSHNPNAFRKAADLGIELTLAGHTHGGQVQVEILDHHLSPARFMTDFVAGLYQKKVASGKWLVAGKSTSLHDSGGRMSDVGRLTSAHLYVNRGIGTVGTPIRVGSPPEITLLTLRRA
ncbi:MAG: metallophosphoesterase [Candidatus Acidiferrales bacterium]